MNIIAILALFILCGLFFIKLFDVLLGSAAPQIQVNPQLLPEIEKSLQIRPTDIIWEVGCGDARVISYCAKSHPKSKFIGIEISIQMYLLAKWRTRKQQNVKIVFANLRKYPPKNATIIYLYLLPTTVEEYKKLIPKGARVVSLEFMIPGVKVKEVVSLKHQGRFAHKLYIHQF